MPPTPPSPVLSSPVVRTEVEIGEHRFEIDLTLTCRRRMGFRMLLGRRVLEDRYRVDPARSFLLTGTT